MRLQTVEIRDLSSRSLVMFSRSSVAGKQLVSEVTRGMNGQRPE